MIDFCMESTITPRSNLKNIMGLGRILAFAAGLTACAAPELKPQQLGPSRQYEVQLAKLERSLSATETAEQLRDFATVEHCAGAIELQTLTLLALHEGMGDIRGWAAADQVFARRSRVNRRLMALACRGQNEDNPTIKDAEEKLKIAQGEVNSDLPK